MDITRRQILSYGGGGALLVLGSGGLWQVSRWNKNLDQARKPWQIAGKDFGDIRLNCAAWAILAPNPHNLQPWQIQLRGKNKLRLFCDSARRLPATDPLNRQLTIGFGAFLELLRMAAASEGYRLAITPFPQGAAQPVLDNRPLADVAFVKDASVRGDPLFQFARTRRTQRVEYNEKAVSPETLKTLTSVPSGLAQGAGGFGAVAAEKKSAVLAKLCLDAWHIELNTEATWAESVQWTSVGSAAVRDNPSGISLFGVPFELAGRAGILSPEKSMDKSSLAFQGSKDFYDGLINTARGWGWIWTKNNRRTDQLDAGKAWVRLHLQATKLGVSMHPLSQALQEFPEMKKPYEEVHRLLGLDRARGETLQGLFRFGYSAKVPAAPRRGLKKHLLKT